MSQDSLTIPTVGVNGADFGADIQKAIRAAASLQHGAADAPYTEPGLAQLHAAVSEWVLRFRNAADDGWVNAFMVDPTHESAAAGPAGIAVTRAAIETKAIPATVVLLRASGYAAVGDGGGGLYKRAVAEPAHALKVLSADGAWWELVPGQGRIVNARQAGALGDDAANDTAALQSILAAGYDLLVPEGTFLTDSLVPTTTGQSILGIGPKSVLKQRTATNQIINEQVGTPSRLTVRGVFFQGAAGAAGAIRLDNWDEVTIEGCWFDGFGTAATDWLSSPIHLTGTTDVRIVNNTSLSGNISSSGADIYLAGRVARAVVTGNILLSDSDAGILVSLNASTNDDDAAYHTITDNIIHKATPNASGRHGIVAVYASKVSRTTITGNVIRGSNWVGIYLAAGEPDTDDDSAGVTITGNAIYNVAGGSDVNIELYGGITISGNSGITVTGNLIHECGINADGTTATEVVPGIRVVNSCRGATITGNHIYKCTGNGIRVYTLGYTCENITIVGNVMRENKGNGVLLFKVGTTGHQKNIRVAENVVYMEDDVVGIHLSNTSSGNTVQSDLVFESNTVVCTHGTPTQPGMRINADPTGACHMIGNHIRGFATGILCAASLGDRVVGDTIRLDRNYIDCPTAFNLTVSSGFALVCDNEYGPSVTSQFGGSGNFRTARRIGSNNSAVWFYEVNGAKPTSGAWTAGDRSLDLAPSAGGKIGSVCVTGGSPGTWKDYGAIDA